MGINYAITKTGGSPVMCGAISQCSTRSNILQVASLICLTFKYHFGHIMRISEYLLTAKRIIDKPDSIGSAVKGRCGPGPDILVTLKCISDWEYLILILSTNWQLVDITFCAKLCDSHLLYKTA